MSDLGYYKEAKEEIEQQEKEKHIKCFDEQQAKLAEWHKYNKTKHKRPTNFTPKKKKRK